MRKARNPPIHPAADLFGEIPVTAREVALWMWRVPVWRTRWSQPRRVANYIRNYNVVEKIRAYKAAGRLEEIFGDECCPHCGTALERDQDAEIEALRAEIARLKGEARPAPVRPMARVLRLLRAA